MAAAAGVDERVMSRRAHSRSRCRHLSLVRAPQDEDERLLGAGRDQTRGSLIRSQHHHGRTGFHPAVEIDHVLIGQPDTARGNCMSDPSGLVRAMDAIEGVLAVGIKVERAGAHWIGGPAFDIARQQAEPPLLIFGRRPSRPLLLVTDRGDAGPCLALLADDGAVTNRLALGKHVVNVARVGIDHDRSWRFLAGEVDDLTAIGGRDPGLLIRRGWPLVPGAGGGTWGGRRGGEAAGPEPQGPPNQARDARAPPTSTPTPPHALP